MALTPTPDLELQRLAATGDRVAMQTLLLGQYDRLMQYISRRLSRYIQGLISAEDMVQDVCVIAMSKQSTFVIIGARSFEQWLITVAKNHLRSVMRMHKAKMRDRRRELGQEPVGEDSSVPTNQAASNGPSPSSFMGRHEATLLLNRAMGTLKSDYQRVLHLRYVECKTLAQTAGEMGRTESAVLMLTHRALKELKEILGSRSQYF